LGLHCPHSQPMQLFCQEPRRGLPWLERGWPDPSPTRSEETSPPSQPEEVDESAPDAWVARRIPRSSTPIRTPSCSPTCSPRGQSTNERNVQSQASPSRNLSQDSTEGSSSSFGQVYVVAGSAGLVFTMRDVETVAASGCENAADCSRTEQPESQPACTPQFDERVAHKVLEALMPNGMTAAYGTMQYASGAVEVPGGFASMNGSSAGGMRNEYNSNQDSTRTCAPRAAEVRHQPALAHWFSPAARMHGRSQVAALSRTTGNSATSFCVSAGSVGHPFSCADACKYARRPKGCKDGAACVRCHFCEWNRYSMKRHAAKANLRADGWEPR